jgi:signal transduction histidine kinase
MKGARRLYLHLYLGFVGITLASLIAAALVFRVLSDLDDPPARYLRESARLLMRQLPPPSSPRFRADLRALAQDLDVDLLVLAPDGHPIAETSRRPFPPLRRLQPGLVRGPGGPVFVAVLSDGHRLVMRDRRGGNRIALFLLLGLVAAGMAVGSYPIARRITRRLERLEQGARRWGQGDLGHRVPEVGRDEVARVAAAFNKAAEQIEGLLAQQKQMLANTSHELRSPLARLRMALELVAEEPDAGRRRHLVDRAHEDILDLDGLVEEILIMARSDPKAPRRPLAAVDLGALVVSETERAGATSQAAGDLVLMGDETMLRRMVRNLLDNARVHAGNEGVHAAVSAEGESVVLAVEDRGPGVPEGEREKIFAPFYRPVGQSLRPGAGLGLALVQQVAAYHGGGARCLPRAGGGSRFEVRLPIAKHA